MSERITQLGVPPTLPHAAQALRLRLGSRLSSVHSRISQYGFISAKARYTLL